jgi:hypothetical protein
MARIGWTLAVMTILALLLQAVPVAVQEPNVAHGQLVRIDTSAKVLVVRLADGAQMRFSFTDNTTVTGADEGVAGLGTKEGTTVTVTYQRIDQENVALQIEVQRSKR